MLFNFEAVITEKIYKGSVCREKNLVAASDTELNTTRVNFRQPT